MASTKGYVSIPRELYNKMALYFLDEEYRTPEIEAQIEKGICDKLDREIDRELYTKYKSAPTPEQREQARKEYLDRKGIHKDFRW